MEDNLSESRIVEMDIIILIRLMNLTKCSLNFRSSPSLCWVWKEYLWLSCSKSDSHRGLIQHMPLCAHPYSRFYRYSECRSGQFCSMQGQYASEFSPELMQLWPPQLSFDPLFNSSLSSFYRCKLSLSLFQFDNGQMAHSACSALWLVFFCVLMK